MLCSIDVNIDSLINSLFNYDIILSNYSCCSCKCSIGFNRWNLCNIKCTTVICIICSFNRSSKMRLSRYFEAIEMINIISFICEYFSNDNTLIIILSNSDIVLMNFSICSFNNNITGYCSRSYIQLTSIKEFIRRFDTCCNSSTIRNSKV